MVFEYILDFAFGALGAFLLATLFGVLTYNAIKDWIKKAKLRRLNAKYAELIKQYYNDGNYVVCKISDNTGTDENSWEYKKLDSELQQKFGGKEKILIPIEEVA